jgi:MoxR-vWA-beta-propeller ternary system domain bpX2
MNSSWALAAPLDSVGVIARLRQVPGLAVCEDGKQLWLRGPALDESLAASLRLIPGGQQFTVLADGQLIAAGKLVPSGRLPQGPWRLLADWLALELPPVCEAAKARE